MTDPTGRKTAKPPTPDAAADPTASTHTSKPNAGDAAKFRFSNAEAIAVEEAVFDYLKGNITTIPALTTRIEDIVNKHRGT